MIFIRSKALNIKIFSSSVGVSNSMIYLYNSINESLNDDFIIRMTLQKGNISQCKSQILSIKQKIIERKILYLFIDTSL